METIYTMICINLSHYWGKLATCSMYLESWYENVEKTFLYYISRF